MRKFLWRLAHSLFAVGLIAAVFLAMCALAPPILLLGALNGLCDAAGRIAPDFVTLPARVRARFAIIWREA